jgi:hypothetical protein
VRGPALPRAGSALLTAAIGRQAQSRGGLPRPERHRPGLRHPRCPPRVSHGPADPGPRAQRQDDGARPPACARGQEGHRSASDARRGLPRTCPVALRRGPRRGLPRRGGGVEPAPRWAVQPRLGQHAPHATAPHLGARLGAQLVDPRRPGRPAPLGQSGFDLGLPWLRSVSLRAGRAAAPRGRAPARALQEPPQAPDAARRVLLGAPGGRDGRGGAKAAAAVGQIARSSCTRAVAWRRRCSAADRCASWTCCSWRAARCYVPLQGCRVWAWPPRSRAVWARDGADATASGTARSLTAAAEVVVVAGLIEHPSYAAYGPCLRVSGRV